MKVLQHLALLSTALLTSNCLFFFFFQLHFPLHLPLILLQGQAGVLPFQAAAGGLAQC